MITEDYVSFETAKLLKEKEFNGECEYFYVNGKLVRAQGTPGGPYNWNARKTPFNECSAPTLQMAMKWLRKKHKIFIRPNTSFQYPIKWYAEIFCYGDNLKTQQDVSTESYESPEQACEAAIKYCLENLI